MFLRGYTKEMKIINTRQTPEDVRLMRRKRKPDLLAVLVVVVGLGVIATAFAQGILAPSSTETHLASHQMSVPVSTSNTKIP